MYWLCSFKAFKFGPLPHILHNTMFSILFMEKRKWKESFGLFALSFEFYFPLLVAQIQYGENAFE